MHEYIRLCRVAVIALALCHAAGTGPGQCDEPAVETRGHGSPFAPLFRRLAQKEEDRGDLLSEILQANYSCRSGDNDRPFQFDFHLLGQRKDQSDGRALAFLRCLLQYRQGCGASMMIDLDNVPSTLLAHETALELREAGWKIMSEDVRFGFVVDDKHSIEHFDAKAAPASIRDYILFDLSSFLRDFLGNTSPQMKWHVNGVLEIEKRPNARAEVRFRTPNDELRFGTPFAEFRIETNDPFVQSYRGFCHAANPRLWLTVGDRKRIAAQLSELNRPLDQKERYRQFVFVPPDKSAGYLLWREILPCWCEPAEKFSPRAIRALIDARKSVVTTLLAAEKVLARPSGREGIAVDDLLDANLLASLVSTCLVHCREALQMHLAPGDLPTDDPIMIARELESTIGPWEYEALCVSVPQRLLRSSKLDREQRIGLVHALGVAGTSSKSFEFLLIGDRLDLFEQAVLRSHWQLPFDSRHIEACVAVISEKGLQATREACAVETLVRLNSVDRVPDAMLRRWFTERILESPANDRHLAAVTACSSGRAFLVRWCESVRNDRRYDDARNAAVQVLQSRLRATLTCQRYDFMSKEECRQVRTFLENCGVTDGK